MLAIAEEKLFAPLRAALGLDEAKLVNVGAAPTPREVLVFFHAIGVPLAEIWGMSETCGAGASNPAERIKIGTVGLPSPGVELKLAEDGELLARSKVVMVGYRNLPERTAEALDDDGWLHTGDVATIDEDGYVTLIDRKKELIISAAGKNMSPANIEATLKGSSPLIGQACVIGDGRRYNTALLVLDPDVAPAWAARHGIEGDGQLARDEQVRAAVQEAVDAANATPVAPRADQALHARRRRLAARWGRADADDEAQAPPRRGQVRGADRGHVRITADRAMSPRPAGVISVSRSDPRRLPRGDTPFALWLSHQSSIRYCASRLSANGFAALSERRRRADRRRRARRGADDDQDRDRQPAGDDGPDPSRRRGRRRHRARRRPARQGHRGAEDDRRRVADPDHRRHPLQPHAGAEGDRGRRALHPPEPGQHRRARQGRRGRRPRPGRRHADAHRRQLRLAAQAPARARVREPRRGARDRRRPSSSS